MTARHDPNAAHGERQQMPGRGAPVGPLRQELREQAHQAIARQPSRTVTVLSSLLAAQDEIGYLPPEAIDEVSQRTGSSANEVWGVASFYPNFRFTEPARHIVELCWGPTCDVLGAQHILQGLLERLGLESEGDTPDGEITLKLNTCLGVCPHAPAMSFDRELTGHMTLERALRSVELLRVEVEEQQRADAIAVEEERTRKVREARTAEWAAARAAAAAEAEKAAAEAQAEASPAPEPAVTAGAATDAAPAAEAPDEQQIDAAVDTESTPSDELASPEPAEVDEGGVSLASELDAEGQAPKADAATAEEPAGPQTEEGSRADSEHSGAGDGSQQRGGSRDD